MLSMSSSMNVVDWCMVMSVKKQQIFCVLHMLTMAAWDKDAVETVNDTVRKETMNI